MSFWEKVNNELKRAVEEGWSVLKDTARIGKLRYNKYTLTRKADKCFSKIGGIVYEMAKPPWENPLSRPEVLKLVEEIKKLESEMTALEEEIDRVKEKEEEESA